MTTPMINPEAHTLRRDLAERILLSIIAREGVSNPAWENAANKQRQVRDAVAYADLLFAELVSTAQSPIVAECVVEDAWTRVPIEDTSP